jgi:hypothetical protein
MMGVSRPADIVAENACWTPEIGLRISENSEASMMGMNHTKILTPFISACIIDVSSR